LFEADVGKNISKPLEAVLDIVKSIYFQIWNLSVLTSMNVFYRSIIHNDYMWILPWLVKAMVLKTYFEWWQIDLAHWTILHSMWLIIPFQLYFTTWIETNFLNYHCWFTWCLDQPIFTRVFNNNVIQWENA